MPSASQAHPDRDFDVNTSFLSRAVALLSLPVEASQPVELKHSLGESGIDLVLALEDTARTIIGQARRLGAPTTFAHMDPPTPLASWVGELWNARLNQNLLHPETSPAARLVEDHVMAWLCPWFGMSGGQFTAGSTLANLTALWAAREIGGVKEVIASCGAHVSIEKAAHLLGLSYRQIPVTAAGSLDPEQLQGDLDQSALVLIAGATSTGAVDTLALAGRAKWTHVDAAWAGPLRFSDRHASNLAGIEAADSVAVSAHKLMFQPKGSAFVLFKDVDAAWDALSFGATYLSTPNVGLLGSRGAVAVPLYLTLLAWGRRGLAERIDRCMAAAESFADWVEAQPSLALFARPQTGVILWKPADRPLEALFERLPAGLASTTSVKGERWIRNVSANPQVDVSAVVREIEGHL
jgi:L-2,4-diaminobutyrate decarboxylase